MVEVITIAAAAIFACLWVVTRGKMVEARSFSIVVAARGIRQLHRRGMTRRRAIQLVCPELADILERKTSYED